MLPAFHTSCVYGDNTRNSWLIKHFREFEYLDRDGSNTSCICHCVRLRRQILFQTKFSNPEEASQMLTSQPFIEAGSINGGEIGIRTLDTLLTYAGFQDRCIQPLCHLSALYDVFNESSAQV